MAEFLDVRRKPKLMLLWALCVAVLIGPALLVWGLRLSALGCTPGPQLCYGLPLGAGLREALRLSWAVSTNSYVLVGLSVLAALLAFGAKRPMLGTLTILTLPVASPLLPQLAVFVSRYAACPAASDSLGVCRLWGAAMGSSFQNAAIAYDLVCEIVPFTVALTVMLGLLGFFFTRPKQTAPAMARMQRSLESTDWGDRERWGGR